MQIKDSAITSSINAIALADLQGRITYVNPAFVRMWGYAAMEEILDKSVMDFWTEDEPVAEIVQTLIQGDSWQGEMHARKKDHSQIIVDVSAHLVQDDSGHPLCMMSSFVDITARKTAEAAEKEEHRLVDALRKTAEALSSTLKLEDVLERILESAGDVIDNDSMSIMLLDGDKLRVVRHRGYTERGMQAYIENTEFSLEKFETLRKMVDTLQPTIIPDVQETSLWKEQHGMEWVRSYAGVPIYKREKVIGFLNLESSTPNHFTAAQGNRLKAFASQAAVAIENASLYEQDHILSITDGLTGLYNSRYFYELSRLEFDRARRYPGHLSLIMIDIDHFKQVNDQYGHMVGDDVLRETARRIRTCLRSVDLAARYGGEEFTILMGQTNGSDALQVATRVHEAVSRVPFELKVGNSLSLTISLGLVTMASVHENFNMLIKDADDALYTAKNSGRDQIVVWNLNQPGRR